MIAAVGLLNRRELEHGKVAEIGKSEDWKGRGWMEKGWRWRWYSRGAVNIEMG